MWGAPHSGFSRLSVRINWRTSLGTAGRPRLPWRIFQLQNRPKPFRCQPITVAALTMETRDSQPFQTEESHAQKKRSAGLNFGRLTERGARRVDDVRPGSPTGGPPGSETRRRGRRKRPLEQLRNAND